MSAATLDPTEVELSPAEAAEAAKQARLANLNKARQAKAQRAKADRATQQQVKAEALAKPVADAFQALRLEPPPVVREAVVAQAAADFTPDPNEQVQGDISRLLATEIEAIYRKFGITPPGRGDMMTELLATGDPVMRPVPGRPDEAATLPPDEERRRQERNRSETLALLAAPSSKRRMMLDALRTSPPISYYSPEPMHFIINSVHIQVPAGLVPAKRTPDAIDIGCVLVAEVVNDRGRARTYETIQKERMHWQELKDDSLRSVAEAPPPSGIW